MAEDEVKKIDEITQEEPPKEQSLLSRFVQTAVVFLVGILLLMVFVVGVDKLIEWAKALF
ncbi:MAG: hypothetical protein LBS74_08570 [Oscillospiraceae bacterium]|jgi:hypothetical protein|nr:hypothetical protein [Oscillospiraceae bacterium]